MHYQQYPSLTKIATKVFHQLHVGECILFYVTFFKPGPTGNCLDLSVTCLNYQRKVCMCNCLSLDIYWHTCMSVHMNNYPNKIDVRPKLLILVILVMI